MGTRLRPLTETVPKCLVQIGEKPLLEYWLDTLVNVGIKEILINTHYLSEQIESFVETSKYKKYITLTYEPVLLNTGGTLLHNKRFFEGDSILFIHADNFSVCDYQAFIQAHRQRPDNTIGTMMTFDTDNPESCGIVKKNSTGIMTGFYEKIKNPPSNLANGAVYIFEPDIFDVLKQEQKINCDFSNDILPKLIGKLYTFHNNFCHIDIGTIDNYQLACQYVEKNS